MHGHYGAGFAEDRRLFSQRDDHTPALLDDRFDVQVVTGRGTWAESDEDDVSTVEVDRRWAAAKTAFPQVQREGLGSRQQASRSVREPEGLNA